MRTETISVGYGDLVEELKQLEAFFPVLDDDDQDQDADPRADLEEEIEDLEQLIAAAGEPEDEHSMRALAFLQSELLIKRAQLDSIY
jgi:hypothetical protein